MPTQNDKSDVSRDAHAQDATFGGFERRLSYDRIVRRIERKRKKKEDSVQIPDEKPSQKKYLATVLFSLALGAAAVLAVGLWLWLK